MLRLAILASGSGSNLQAILDAAENNRLGEIIPVLVISDRPCKALQRGLEAGIETAYLDKIKYGERLSYHVGELLDKHSIDIVALAGWLSILDEKITENWAGRMVNIHPSLLPLHGGLYGINVHKSVLDSGDKESGCTVHFVTAEVDGGQILGQARVPVLDKDSPESLAARILVEEHRLYPEILAGLSAALKSRVK